VLRSRIFGSKREEETGGGRKLHTEELHHLYSSLNVSVRLISTRGSFPGVKQPGRAADHSLPSSAEVKECVEL